MINCIDDCLYKNCAVSLTVLIKGLKKCKSNKNPLCTSMKNGDEFHYICRNIVGSETKELVVDANCDHCHGYGVIIIRSVIIDINNAGRRE